MRGRAWVAAVSGVLSLVFAGHPRGATPPEPSVGTLPAPAEKGWQGAYRDYRWSFPEDHWSHPSYRTEWWYFTGQLETEDEPRRHFGYQFTVFRIGLVPVPPRRGSSWAARELIMGHAALSELDRGRHRFSELLYRAIPLLASFGSYPDARIAATRAPAGTDGRWTLSWNGRGFDFEMADSAQAMAFRLSAVPERPLVFQGPNGYSVKGANPDAGSQYYSFPRMATQGVLQVDGHSLRVRGESWMDREFASNALGKEQVGWDWFGLRLEDGRDLMLYLLRRPDGSVDFRSATLVGRDGRARYLTPREWNVHPLATWKSPASGVEYPSRWLVVVPEEGLRLEVAPDLADQENRSRLSNQLVYWEGSVTARSPGLGAVGRGYVELTGYGNKSRPSL